MEAEAFPVGSHVVIELMNERKLAGYIVGAQEEGILLKMTHKDSELVRSLSSAMSAEIERQLSEKNQLWLRSSMLVRGHVRGVFASRDHIEWTLKQDVEADILDQYDDGMQFRELSVPVTAFVNAGAILTMESTADKLEEAEVSIFNQTFDEELKELYTKTKEEHDGTEGVGTDSGD